MSGQLDILALEPFFGGVRRLMLETLIRFSRHRWTVLKLPPRRIERRLTVAAHWFSEQLSRHWVGSVDLLFTSEAMNLADLFRLTPGLSRRPSVVYFHDNQLPAIGQTKFDSVDLVNLNSAQVADEIWFNSMFHLRDFFGKAACVIDASPDLRGRDPIPGLSAKSRVIHPPLDMELIHDEALIKEVSRNKKLVFVDTRDADTALLNNLQRTLARRSSNWEFVTVGPVEMLDADFPRRTVGERDRPAQARALREASVIISARRSAMMDHYAIMGLEAGCWPFFPRTSIYPELIPQSMHAHCLHDGTAQRLASMLQDVWRIETPHGYQQDLRKILNTFDAVAAAREMDAHLERVAKSRR